MLDSLQDLFALSSDAGTKPVPIRLEHKWLGTYCCQGVSAYAIESLVAGCSRCQDSHTWTLSSTKLDLLHCRKKPWRARPDLPGKPVAPGRRLVRNERDFARSFSVLASALNTQKCGKEKEVRGGASVLCPMPRGIVLTSPCLLLPLGGSKVASALILRP